MNEALRTDYRAGELAIEYLYIDNLYIDYLDVRVKQMDQVRRVNIRRRCERHGASLRYSWETGG